MALPLIEIANILRAAGLQVVEYIDWKQRSRTGNFAPRGLLIHHDASAVGPSPGVPAYMANPVNNGAQLWVDTKGVWWVIAAGRMPHAGLGVGWGVIPRDEGNTYSVGVETDHTVGEAWPEAQLESLIRGSQAICRAYGWNPANAVAGHKEYAAGRKIDPDGIDMNWFRQQLLGDIVTPQEMDAVAQKVVEKLINFRVDNRNLWDSEKQGLANQQDDATQSQVNEVKVGIADLKAQVAEIREMLAKLFVGGVDVNQIAKAVADEEARRLAD